MVGGLRAGGRVAAASLLALGCVAPLNGAMLVATPVVPAAETSTACAVTVGTATTDPALAADAARAVAVGYTATDCLPDAALLAAAEARAAIPMDASTPTPATTAVSSQLGGASSSGSVALAPATTTMPAAVPTTTETPTSTETTTSDTTAETTSTDTSTETTASETTGETSSESDDDESSGNRSDSGNDPDDSEDPDVVPDPDPTAVDGASTAAGKRQWGTAGGVEDFNDAALSNWGVYDGEGHAGNGLRSPSAMSVSGGILTITGDANGTTGGMAWDLGRAKYGRWEARVKSPAADPSYNAVMLLWPDEDNWPVGGEVDFMEIGDETRQQVDFFLHYGADNNQDHGSVDVNAAEWHNWAVEWSPTAITAYVDGEPWYTNTDSSQFPPGSMHLTLQLDWFPKGGSVQQSAMHVDWVRYYPINGAGASDAIVNSVDNTSDTGVTLNRAVATDATDGGTTDGSTDGSTDEGDSVAGATSTTTVTITPEAEDTTTDAPEPTTSGDSTGGDSTGDVATADGADVTVTENAEENGGNATPSPEPEE